MPGLTRHPSCRADEAANFKHHAAKSCPGRPRRIDKAVGAARRLLWVFSISWPRRGLPGNAFAETWLALVVRTPMHLVEAGATPVTCHAGLDPASTTGKISGRAGSTATAGRSKDKYETGTGNCQRLLIRLYSPKQIT
jgi:hypothetical protein